MLGTLGDAKADAINAQAGANTALLLLQVEQALAEEPLLSKVEAVAERNALIKKLHAEIVWQAGSAWGAGFYGSLIKTERYLKEAYYPQDISPIQTALDMADIRTQITLDEVEVPHLNTLLKDLDKALLSSPMIDKVFYGVMDPSSDTPIDVVRTVIDESAPSVRAIRVSQKQANARLKELLGTPAIAETTGFYADTGNSFIIDAVPAVLGEIDNLKHKLTLYPGATIAVTAGGYGIPHPVFNHPGGNADYINGAAGANTSSILLMLSEYESMEALLPSDMQVTHRVEIIKIISDEIKWQVGYAWGANAYQSLQEALKKLRSRPYPVFVDGLGGTDFGDLGSSGITGGDFFALSDIIPLTKQDFSKILEVMEGSDWYVTGITRLFNHDEYVEMLAKAWSSPYYMREWLLATRTEADIIGFRPSSCADIISRVRSGHPSAISYRDAAIVCLTPKKKKGMFGGMGGIIGIILAVAIAAVTWGTGLVASFGVLIADTVGVSAGLATTIASAAIIAAGSSTIIQAVTTGTVNPLNVAIAAVAAGAMIGVSSVISDIFTPSSNINLSPPVKVPTDVLDKIAPTTVPTSLETFDLIPDGPWYQSTVNLPLVGDTNLVELATKQLVSSGLNAGQQAVKTGEVDTVSIGAGVLASTVTPIVVGAGTVISNIVTVDLGVDTTLVSNYTPTYDIGVESPVSTELSSDLDIFQDSSIGLNTGLDTGIPDTVFSPISFDYSSSDIPSFDSVSLNVNTQETVLDETPTEINSSVGTPDILDKIVVSTINTGFKGLFTQLLTDSPDKLVRSPITTARAPIGYHYNSSGNIVSDITRQVTLIQDTTVQTQSEIGVPWGLVFSLFTAKENNWI